ncbi:MULTISPECIES: ANTAR domain-containing protein [Mycolicibacterium]|uniref:Response regulator receiver and ANTAR domain protein n=2 Tax=Mycobacteriaceae TaxID=1762 RepID=A1TG05_MYCVP|nr:response regulator receiver and ANTAR domain protein [Mycolicibacterium vanbaalenii PYR-1]MCV7129604.1 ANTAR domain-containing protein [Mycolicibacterium vanbaalenii PYR-1]QZY45640.1 ANTAR domain-containing protein [Mycolicibacterium austroafricanum]UJL30755.1 ANTAR domain-containing protein [Mycolicibacterium vanbaalenii]
MHAPLHPDLLSRRSIDVAVGILMALRRCSEDQAFAEIAAAAHRMGLPLGEVTRALIAVADAHSGHTSHRDEALRIWGELFSEHPRR